MFGVFGASHSPRGQRVLDAVSFEVDAGEWLSLIGPNGSGKTTLLKIAAGLVHPDGGVLVRFRGEPMASLSIRERAKRVAYLAADLVADFPMTAWEAVSLGRTAYGGAGGEERVRSALARCGCAGLADRSISTLSGGERQRVLLARAIAQEARVLLLDETLSRMDLHHQLAAGGLLREYASREGLAVVLVSHDLSLATEWADRCLLLAGGRAVACGPPKEVVTEERLRLLYPSSAFSVRPSPETGAPKVFLRR